jgi:hypothetical protein
MSGVEVQEERPVVGEEYELHSSVLDVLPPTRPHVGEELCYTVEGQQLPTREIVTKVTHVIDGHGYRRKVMVRRLQ